MTFHEQEPQPTFGFGPGPVHPGHRHGHRHRHDARGEFQERTRGRRGGPGAFMGGGFGPGFGPGFGRGFGPGFPLGFGMGEHRGRGRGRGQRGDVRAAILALLVERPMHGYEMIREIGERSNNMWRPSPGSVYPTLQLLVDEGLIAETEGASSRKQFELTEEGRAAAEKLDTPPWEKIAESADPNIVDLQTAVSQLMIAISQASQTLSPDQQQRIVDIVNAARKQVYGILGEID